MFKRLGFVNEFNMKRDIGLETYFDNCFLSPLILERCSRVLEPHNQPTPHSCSETRIQDATLGLYFIAA